MTRWADAARISSPAGIDQQRIDGSHPSQRAVREVVAHPRRPLIADYATVPAELPFLPFAELAEWWAAGRYAEVRRTVHDQLTDEAGGRASSLAQVAALREWRDAALDAVLDRIAVLATRAGSEVLAA